MYKYCILLSKPQGSMRALLPRGAAVLKNGFGISKADTRIKRPFSPPLLKASSQSDLSSE